MWCCLCGTVRLLFVWCCEVAVSAVRLLLVCWCAGVRLLVLQRERKDWIVKLGEKFRQTDRKYSGEMPPAAVVRVGEWVLAMGPDISQTRRERGTSDLAELVAASGDQFRASQMTDWYTSVLGMEPEQCMDAIDPVVCSAHDVCELQLSECLACRRIKTYQARHPEGLNRRASQVAGPCCGSCLHQHVAAVDMKLLFPCFMGDSPKSAKSA